MEIVKGSDEDVLGLVEWGRGMRVEVCGARKCAASRRARPRGCVGSYRTYLLY